MVSEPNTTQFEELAKTTTHEYRKTCPMVFLVARRRRKKFTLS